MTASYDATCGVRRWRASLEELSRLDRALYAAVAGSETPTLDAGLRRLSLAADQSKLWLGIAAGMALLGGSRSRRAAATGVGSIALASASVNLLAKPMARRRRPQRDDDGIVARHVPMPLSTSFPSGHSASAFAFAEGVSSAGPWPGLLIRLVATAVAESRVHSGVHYPGDVVAGALIGMTAGEVVATVVDRATRAAVARRGMVGP
jgi:membrane-associated phospholipid phosphatase